MVQTIARRLGHPRYDELRRSILNWLKTDIWPSRVDGLDIRHIQTLQELGIMLIEERPKFADVPFRKGREEGREEGLQIGRQEGEAILLKRQIERRFGPLSHDTRARIESAIPAQLETWSLNILDAQDLDDVFSE